MTHSLDKYAAPHFPAAVVSKGFGSRGSVVDLWWRQTVSGPEPRLHPHMLIFIQTHHEDDSRTPTYLRSLSALGRVWLLHKITADVSLCSVATFRSSGVSSSPGCKLCSSRPRFGKRRLRL